MENDNNNTTASGSLSHKRPVRKTLNVTPEVYDKIKAHCQKYGLSFIVFVERALIKEIEDPRQPAIERAFAEGVKSREKSEPPADKSLIMG